VGRHHCRIRRRRSGQCACRILLHRSGVAALGNLGVEIEAGQMLAAGRQDVWEVLTRRFESRLILTALANTRGRRIEAAHKLGIGRNTITRKIQDLGLE
jgi:two-component system nitrogen regulation response regulator GlnG